MAFSTVWGFGNITNGFVYFNGPQVIFSWIFMFVLYFIPYALMVGELGSAFKNEGGGVSSWLHQTTNAKLAYYAGWTYWACHITYIASKGSGFLKALSWAVFRNAETYDSFPTRYIQLATFCILLLGCYIASLGLNPLKKLLTAALLGAETTANAYKAGASAPLGVTPTNLYFTPSDRSRAQLLAEMGEGVFITNVKGLHAGANPTTGDFSLEAKGYLVTGGQLGRPVSGITVAGNFYELLKAVRELYPSKVRAIRSVEFAQLFQNIPYSGPKRTGGKQKRGRFQQHPIRLDVRMEARFLHAEVCENLQACSFAVPTDNFVADNKTFVQARVGIFPALEAVFFRQMCPAKKHRFEKNPVGCRSIYGRHSCQC